MPPHAATQTDSEPIYRDAQHARTIGRRYRRMADEVAGYPEHDGQQEKVSELRGRSAHAYRAARALEADAPAPARRPKKEATAKPEPFNPKRALRRAGVRAGQQADRAARATPRTVKRTVSRSGALPALGTSGVGGLVVYVFVSIIALALLDNMLGGRGPAAISKSLGFLTAIIQRLVNPVDPIVPRGTLPGAPAAATSTGASTRPASSAISGGARVAQTTVHTVRGG